MDRIWRMHFYSQELYKNLYIIHKYLTSIGLDYRGCSGTIKIYVKFTKSNKSIRFDYRGCSGTFKIYVKFTNIYQIYFVILSKVSFNLSQFLIYLQGSLLNIDDTPIFYNSMCKMTNIEEIRTEINEVPAIFCPAKSHCSPEFASDHRDSFA